ARVRQALTTIDALASPSTDKPAELATAASQRLGNRPQLRPPTSGAVRSRTCHVCGKRRNTVEGRVCQAPQRKTAPPQPQPLFKLLLAQAIAAPDDDTTPYAGLRRWAHMLGFGGHFLTKSRRYSIAFRILREARTAFRRN